MAYGVGGHIEGFDILEWLEMSGTTLDGGFKDFQFSPLPGEMIQFDYIFRWGWNHQVVHHTWTYTTNLDVL